MPIGGSTESNLSEALNDRNHTKQDSFASGYSAYEQRLKVENLSLSFGRVKALVNVSFTLKDGEIVAIIGPNGAGKTCVINCISGFYRPEDGHVLLDGKEITGKKPDKIAALGIARTFQNIQLYTGLTALDNILAGRHLHLKSNFLSNALFFGFTRKEEVNMRMMAEEIIDFLELEDVREKIVGTLPYGIRKRVELGRALALEPRVLILDEPMAGMNLEEKEDIARFIIDIFEGQKKSYDFHTLKNGIKSILFIEHDMDVVMDISERIIVLDFGNKIAEGLPREIKSNPRVIDAYLGEAE